MKRFLHAWLSFQEHQRVLFFALLIALIVGGGAIAWHSEIEAFPELTNVQVQVITLYPGKAAEEVERQVTVPMEVATNGIAGLINQRSISLFGLSVVTLTFNDDVSLKDARLAASQRLADVNLPPGVQPGLSPESTPVGEIFRYSLSGDLPVDELRLIEDWTLEREFKSIPGVADVVSFGGPRRAIEVCVSIPRMRALGLTVSQVAEALGQNHANAGGSVITHGQEAYLVRSLGLYEKPEDLDYAVLGTQNNGIPIRVHDIGHIQIGHQIRLGQVGRNENDDVVEGIILLRKGFDTLETCRQIRERIVKLNSSVLPREAHIDPIYDRTELIRRSSHTVFHNIIFGVILVCVLLSLGLGLAYWPLTLAVACIIPFSLLTAFVGMRLCGYSPNLISLGAVDFGIMIETAVFAAESILFYLSAKDLWNRETIIEALEEVLAPALLCAGLLLIAFIPILTLQRIEGRIFRPLSITLIAAVIGGQIGALIFIPLFSSWTPAGRQKPAPLESLFEKILLTSQKVAKRLAHIHRLAIWSGGLFLIVLTILYARMGREFLPALNEGALWIRTFAPATISLEAATELVHQVRHSLKQIPEVTDVVSHIGRPDDGTDVNGFDVSEILVQLSDPHHWKTAHTIDGFIKKCQDILSTIPGVEFEYSQPIKDNVDEAISGVKGELVVKLYGPKLEELQTYTNAIADVLRHIPGAQDVSPDQLFGQPELRFTMDHALLARYGMRVTDAEEVLESALLGKEATKMIDDQGRYIDILVKPDLPQNPTESLLSSLPIVTPGGAHVPLGDVSHSQLVEGVTRIFRESGERRSAVKLSVRGRAVVDFVAEATQAIHSKVLLKPSYRFEWAGSFENASRAAHQLLLVVPLCIAAMIVILYTWFRRWHTVGLLLWEIPFALVGGLLALHVMGLYLSISAVVGGIVLIGVTFLTGMMMLSGWTHYGSAWAALQNEGRGILLSSGVAIAGLIPASFSHGIGSEIARPFAVIIVGGLSSSLFFTLILLPALLARTKSYSS